MAIYQTSSNDLNKQLPKKFMYFDVKIFSGIHHSMIMLLEMDKILK